MEPDGVSKLSWHDLHTLLTKKRNDNSKFELDNISCCLKNIFSDIIGNSERPLLTQEHLDDLDLVITELTRQREADAEACLADCYRILRNLCALSPSNQVTIATNSFILAHTVGLLEEALQCQDMGERQLLVVRCAVQFLGNLAVGNLENQRGVWWGCRHIWESLLNLGDTKLQQYTCMLIHTCLSGLARPGSCDQNLEDEVCHNMLLKITQTSAHTELEWGLYVIEDALMLKTFLGVIETNTTVEEKLLVLEVLLNKLQNVGKNDRELVTAPSLENLQHVAAQFKVNAYKILATGYTHTQEELSSLCIMKQLEVLCEATANHVLYRQLQDDSDLLTSLIYLLQSIHEIGKQGDNLFTSVEKIGQGDEVDNKHPVFGLKKDLIRLIGNMVHRHRLNQDKVRELHGIPLILEQTNIDERNPFITQWSVFAVRNLCEENEENKAFLAGLKLEGLSNSVEVLREFGVNAELRGDSIIVKPDEKRRKME